MKKRVPITLLTLCLQLPLAALGDEAVQLTPETAAEDSSPTNQSAPLPSQSAPAPSGSTTLYGSVKKRDTALNATEDAPKTDLQSEAAKTASSPLYELAVKKLAAGQELTSDEYRSLGAGCAGYDSVRTFFKRVGTIIEVYPGSPADKAGIRKGDKIITNDSDEQAKADPTQPLWSVTCGLAGTPVDVTILRHGQPITFTLIRMNIEDIQDDAARHTWEQMIRNLGYPKEGTFTRKSQKDLESSPN